MGISSNSPCPCGSGQKYKRCCKQYHDQVLQPTPLALMKSRYSAYVLGKVDYIIKTTHPRNPNFNTDIGAWKEEIALFCKNTTFHKLEILKTEKVGFDGFVTFRVSISQDGKDLSFTEESRFRKEDGLWLYREGVFKES